MRTYKIIFTLSAIVLLAWGMIEAFSHIIGVGNSISRNQIISYLSWWLVPVFFKLLERDRRYDIYEIKISNRTKTQILEEMSIVNKLFYEKNIHYSSRFKTKDREGYSVFSVDKNYAHLEDSFKEEIKNKLT